jgi:CheY-like chemotaxis protein
MLFAIRGYAELLEEDLTAERVDREEALRNVRAIGNAADRAAELTSQLLAFSRQQVVTSKVVDLNEAIRDVEPMARRLIGENIELRLRFDPEAGRIKADSGQLDQIVMNLVVNARDAMPDGGTATIETANTVFDEPYATEHFDVIPGPYVMLAVSDTGMGMDREVREHIFEPFYTTKELGKGTGLGLATIYGIVRQAGGHIWLYSEPGHGSTFKLYFPRVDAAASVEPGEIVPEPAAASGTVLVVEDEPAVRDMTTRTLERAGYRVIAVGDGEAAIREVERAAGPIDVLVSDVIMPNMSGIQLAELMLERHPSIGLVLLSGYTSETLDLERVTARGATFLAKPLSGAHLLRAVQAAKGAARTTG